MATEDAILHFACGEPIGPNKSAKFRRSGSPTPRDNRDFRLLLWSNGANTGQLAYLRRHFHRSDALRRHIALLACVTHRAEQVCQVS
ncbi:hypothetical protein DPMN_080423 [Dreissena polymorpha]|uniref:Uncharacterized protein n=1 Tax=Dreissena polymorpha TaxID=45954 RepID=A0A9D3YTU8_DREPO|nr:hypothetical protein DPMN_080423 [Dreissena polymorpha]